MLLLLACTGTLPSSTDSEVKDSPAPAATCAEITGTSFGGGYESCYAVGSTMINVGAQATEGCATCTFSVFFYTTPAADQACDSGDINVSVDDDSFEEVGDGGTSGYAGLGSDGPLGACTVHTTSFTADDDNTVAWAGSIEADLVLIDTFGEEVGNRTVTITADIADAE